MAAMRRGGRPEPRYVAAVMPARAIGTTTSIVRPTPASRPAQAPPEVVISSGVSQAWPTAAQASSPTRTRPQPRRSRRRRHGVGLTDKKDRQSERHGAGREHGGDDGGRRRGQALEQQPPRPDGVELQRHDGAPSRGRPFVESVRQQPLQRQEEQRQHHQHRQQIDRRRRRLGRRRRVRRGRAGRRPGRGRPSAPNRGRAPSQSPRPAGGPAATRPARR